MRSPKKIITVALIAVVFAVLFAAYVDFTTSGYRDLDFSNAVVVEKYKSRNHQYLSARVKTMDGKELAVEGMPLESWDEISTGSKISKRAGSSHITVDAP